MRNDLHKRHSLRLTCELCHGHGYEQTEDGKTECSACNPANGEGLRELSNSGDNQTPEN
jgi:DnaJ-class molecular chaperone